MSEYTLFSTWLAPFLEDYDCQCISGTPSTTSPETEYIMYVTSSDTPIKDIVIAPGARWENGHIVLQTNAIKF